MLKIGITGIHGLLGWHLRVNLHSRSDVEIHGAGRETFADAGKLERFVASCDAIVHCAGMNRGDDQEVASTNVKLTQALISACARKNVKPLIVFPSSTHIYRHTPYGESKKICAALFESWGQKAGAKFANFIIPNIFGEGGRPFYNSAVSTFCYQLANGLEPKIINDSEVELIHAQKVAGEIFEAIKKGFSGEKRLEGLRLSVSQLLAKLQGFAATYQQQIMPDLSQGLDLALFNTYRSYLFPKRYPMQVQLHVDERGRLFEAIKTKNQGQCFIGFTKPGITRGNHYHLEKVERFFVLRGSATIAIRRLFSHEVVKFEVKGDAPEFIDIPTHHTHNITNTGQEELVTLFWSHEIFDANKPDTYKEII